MEKLRQLLLSYKANETTFNQFDIESTKLGFKDEDIKRFNEVYRLCKESNLNKIIRTSRGSIKTSGKAKINNSHAYDVRYNGARVILTIILGTESYSFETAYRSKDIKLAGKNAFSKFKRMCESHGINLDSYAITNGKEVKATIEKPMIEIKARYLYCVSEKIHHIDFHNSYPGGLAITHPEFKPVIDELYYGRKEHPEYKLVLNATIGYMQSTHCCGAKWAHLSCDAIKNNNDRIRKLTQDLIANGRKIVGYNTDGIWYQGEIFHGEGEGKEVGQWENDHVNCRFRAKSNGAYEFIEDGKYYPVIRGLTRLDKIQPDREKWQWGDIFQDDAEIIKYAFNEEEGITKIETDYDFDY